MKLADLRRLSIRREFQIRFKLRNGMECVVDQRGVARVTGLNGIPDFNLEAELAAASEFVLDPAGEKTLSTARPIRREELEAMTATAAAPAIPAHEEE
ncbi:MAG TPA: hypothetical protein VMU19_04690 [Bryobacteraceae bacterium]|nr:hypothetical protein [Bryobacteraceae bacterium]